MYVFLDFCQPAQLYAVISFLTLLYFVIIKVDLIWLFIKAIIFIIWIFVLNRMCKEGYKPIAWVLAIVPHLIFLIVTIKQNV
jgi:hypothetical protein